MKRIVALCLAAACLISMVGCAGDTNMDETKQLRIGLCSGTG